MKQKIVVVEDNTEIRKLIRMTLSMDGHEVLEAQTGDEGLDLIKSSKPDIAILDVMTPGNLDGFSVCREIKNDAVTNSIFVILLTAKGQEKDVKIGFDAGANAYLIKPFSPLKLLELISSSSNNSQETL